jgi:Actinobacteria/chloroflexi VLRF1 release factor
VEFTVVKARPAEGGGRWVEISPQRIRGWLDGFYSRHDGAIERGLVLTGVSNGDTATLYPPPGLADAADVDMLLAGLIRPPRIALLLARKGAVAAGVADGTAITVSKVERFYVQGRTAAGGSSQRRYARRRANQADAATARAADIAAKVLLPYAPGDQAHPNESVSALVCGGDRSMIDTVLADRRLYPLALLRHPHLLESAEPRLAVLQNAAATARRVRIHLVP